MPVRNITFQAFDEANIASLKQKAEAWDEIVRHPAFQGYFDIIEDTGCSVSEAIAQTLDELYNDNHRMDVKLTVIKAAIS